jgi:hypothetical protein
MKRKGHRRNDPAMAFIIDRNRLRASDQTIRIE